MTVPIYPLLPEHHHRDVFPTLGRLYAKLMGEHGAEALTVMGDSAGGGMALALTQTLAAEEVPGRLVLLSPWLDAAFGSPEIAAVQERDPLLFVPYLRVLGAAYAGADLVSIATVSPINGPLDHLRRVALFTSTRDVLNPDAHRLRSLAAERAVTVEFHEHDGLVHDWMLLPIPEARAALARVAAFCTG